jgi:xanthine/uracil permease
MVILKKILKFLIIIVCVMVYAYSANMTSIEPDKELWGWICTVMFGIIAAIGLHEFTKHDIRKKEGNSG